MFSHCFFLAIGLCLGLLTAWLERYQVHAEGGEWALTMAQRTLIAGHAFWFYAQKLLWPTGFTFIYPRWEVSIMMNRSGFFRLPLLDWSYFSGRCGDESVAARSLSLLWRNARARARVCECFWLSDTLS